MEQYDDIWISKKEDGSISVEMMDGPIASFKIEAGKVKYSQNSFNGISSNIKTAIQKKFDELVALLK